MEYKEFSAMNTGIQLAAEGNPSQVAEGFQRAEQMVRDLERRFTRFSEDSELSALNRSAGDWFKASPELFEVVQLSLDYFVSTGGLFNPGVLGALEQAGYDRSMTQIQAEGSNLPARDDRQGYQSPPFDQVQLDPDRMLVRVPLEMRIDLGGIAKGWIAERAARRLSRFARACAVNAGGDLYAYGTPLDTPTWPIGLEDPFQPERDLAVLSIHQGAVATSTVTRRTWKQGRQARHHIIDPRTGQPSESPWVSVTAITSHATQAEVLAKALLIAGPDGAEQLLRPYVQAAFVIVDRDGKLWGSEKAREYLYEYHESIQ